MKSSPITSFSPHPSPGAQGHHWGLGKSPGNTPVTGQAWGQKRNLGRKTQRPSQIFLLHFPRENKKPRTGREREKKSFHLQSSRPIVDGGMGGRGGDGARGLHHGGGARLHPRPRPGLQQAPPDTETQCSPVSKGESEQEMAYQSNPHHKWECKIV